jgi:N utilization substance protein B
MPEHGAAPNENHRMSKHGAVPISHRKRARDLLVQALYQWQLSQSPADQIEAEVRADNGRKVDWDYFHHALSTIIEIPQEIDVLFLPHIVDRDVTQLDPIEIGILRLGSFELARRIDVPYKVVINECVELAKKYGAAESHKFVNGVLDKAAQQLRALEINAK